MNRTIRRHEALGGLALVAALALGTTACGDDDDSAAYDDFCDAELAVESAVAQQDPAAIEAAFTGLAEAAPDDASDTVDATITEAKKFLADGGDPTPEFDANYADLIGIVKEQCGFHELDVQAKNYEFVGMDDELDAGPTVITFSNEADEYHEMSILRKNDGVEQSAEELLALPQDEAMELVTQVNGAYAAPGDTGYTVADLEPGSYFVACFIPTGATEEAFQHMMETGEEPDGQPHFMNGMIHEFEVTS